MRKRTYSLSYEKTDNCSTYKTFDTKKELDKYIKTLPKELHSFDVVLCKYSREKSTNHLYLTNQTDLSSNYIKKEVRKVFLK